MIVRQFGLRSLFPASAVPADGTRRGERATVTAKKPGEAAWTGYSLGLVARTET